MMLPELSKLFAFVDPISLLGEARSSRTAIERAVLLDNALGKNTLRGRATTLKKVAELYGLFERPRITRLLLALWGRNPSAHSQLAILCTVARDPLIRDTAPLIFDACPGETVESARFAKLLEERHSGRFAAVTLAGLAQRCASTWTQSGHLGRPPRRKRASISATVEAITYAAILAWEAGHRGQSIVESPWVRILDASADQALQLLRRAQAEDLVRLNVAGHVFELEPSSRLIAAIGREGATLF